VWRLQGGEVSAAAWSAPKCCPFVWLACVLGSSFADGVLSFALVSTYCPACHCLRTQVLQPQLPGG
jgi:hypothetical protein